MKDSFLTLEWSLWLTNLGVQPEKSDFSGVSGWNRAMEMLPGVHVGNTAAPLPLTFSIACLWLLWCLMSLHMTKSCSNSPNTHTNAARSINPLGNKPWSYTSWQWPGLNFAPWTASTAATLWDKADDSAAVAAEQSSKCCQLQECYGHSPRGDLLHINYSFRKPCKTSFCQTAFPA